MLAELNGEVLSLVLDNDQSEIIGAAMLRYTNLHPEVEMDSAAFAGIAMEWMKTQDRIESHRKRIAALEKVVTDMIGALGRNDHAGLAVAQTVVDAKAVIRG